MEGGGEDVRIIHACHWKRCGPILLGVCTRTTTYVYHNDHDFRTHQKRVGDVKKYYILQQECGKFFKARQHKKRQRRQLQSDKRPPISFWRLAAIQDKKRRLRLPLLILLLSRLDALSRAFLLNSQGESSDCKDQGKRPWEAGGSLKQDKQSLRQNGTTAFDRFYLCISFLKNFIVQIGQSFYPCAKHKKMCTTTCCNFQNFSHTDVLKKLI